MFCLVSVPLRGWVFVTLALFGLYTLLTALNVSVPLRGWVFVTAVNGSSIVGDVCFSPLAGMGLCNFVRFLDRCYWSFRFSPLAGMGLCNLSYSRLGNYKNCFSPLAGMGLCNALISVVSVLALSLFQSPCGDGSL